MRDCEFIEVTQSSDSEDNGIYVRTDDRVSTPTKSSTWKHPNEDRSIFYAESATEWRLGTKYGYRFKGTVFPNISFIWILNKFLMLDVLKELLQWDTLLTFFTPIKY